MNLLPVEVFRKLPGHYITNPDIMAERLTNVESCGTQPLSSRHVTFPRTRASVHVTTVIMTSY